MSSLLPSKSTTSKNPKLSSGIPARGASFQGLIRPPTQTRLNNPGTPHLPATDNLRPGERRVRLPVTPNFTNPRANLNKLFDADVTDSSASGDSSKHAELIPGTSSIRMSSNRFSFKAPGRVFSGQLTISQTTNISSALKASSPFRLHEKPKGTTTEGSSSKKRKLEKVLSDTSLDSSLNSSVDASKSVELIKLQSENHRLRFECQSATKQMETERLMVEEKLKQRKVEEDEMATKTREMWSEAEKILNENTRLKEKLDKAESDAIASRKKYEDQIAAIKTENLNKDRQQDKDLRETRTENLGLNEKVRSLTRERDRLVEEKKLHENREGEYQRVLGNCRTLEAELHVAKTEVQAKTAQISDLLASNSLLSNMPEEMKQYRELQVAVPLLRKENEKLREKAALARANEYKIQAQQETIARYEERQRNYCELEMENERLKEQIADWNPPEELNAASPRRIPERLQKLMDQLAESENRRKKLEDGLVEKSREVQELQLSKDELARKLQEAKSAAEAAQIAKTRAEQDYKEKSNALIAVEKERDTLKLIKDTIESTTGRRPDNLIQQKIREVEERATKSHTLATDFEKRYEQRSAELVEVKEELKQIRERYNAEVASNQKIVLRLSEEMDLVKKSRDELEDKLRNAETGSAGNSFVAITLEDSPFDLAQKRYLEDAAKLIEENKLLNEKLNQIRSAGSCPTDLTMNAEDYLKGPGEQVEELKKQIEKLEKQRNMDMNTFKKTSYNFRQICKVLLGWHVRVDSNKVVFRVADGPPSDTIVFEREDENQDWELRMTDYAAANSQYVEEFLRNHHSPPGFFARIILQILSERTLICLGTSPSITP